MNFHKTLAALLVIVTLIAPAAAAWPAQAQQEHEVEIYLPAERDSGSVKYAPVVMEDVQPGDTVTVSLVIGLEGAESDLDGYQPMAWMSIPNWGTRYEVVDPGPFTFMDEYCYDDGCYNEWLHTVYTPDEFWMDPVVLRVPDDYTPGEELNVYFHNNVLAPDGETFVAFITCGITTVDPNADVAQPSPAGEQEAEDGQLLTTCQGDAKPLGYSDTAVYLLPFDAYIEDVLFDTGELDWITFDEQYGYLDVVRTEVVYRAANGGGVEVITYLSGPLHDLYYDYGTLRWYYTLSLDWRNEALGGTQSYAYLSLEPGQDGDWILQYYRDGVQLATGATAEVLPDSGVISLTVPQDELPPLDTDVDGTNYDVETLAFQAEVSAFLPAFLDQQDVETWDSSICYLGEYENEAVTHPQRIVERETWEELDEETRENIKYLTGVEILLTSVDYENLDLTEDEIQAILDELNAPLDEETSAAPVVMDAHAPTAFMPRQSSDLSALEKVLDEVADQMKTAKKVKGGKEYTKKLLAIQKTYEAFKPGASEDPTASGRKLVAVLKLAVSLCPTLDPTSNLLKDLIDAQVTAVSKILDKVFDLHRIIKDKDADVLRGARPSDYVKQLRGNPTDTPQPKRVFFALLYPNNWPGKQAMFDYLKKVSEVKYTHNNIANLSAVPEDVIDWFKDHAGENKWEKLSYTAIIMTGKEGKQKFSHYLFHKGRKPIKYLPYRTSIFQISCPPDEYRVRQWIWDFYEPFVDIIYFYPKKK